MPKLYGWQTARASPEKKELFDHDRRLERQRRGSLRVAALLGCRDVDRHPELFFEEALRRIEDVLLADGDTGYNLITKQTIELWKKKRTG